MKREELVPCEDPLAGIAGIYNASTSTSTKKVASTISSSAATGAGKDNKSQNIKEKKWSRSFAADFAESLWLQDPEKREPVRVQEKTKKVSTSPTSHKNRPKPIHPTLMSQLAEDLTFSENGDLFPLPGEDEQIRLQDEVLWPETCGLAELSGASNQIEPHERAKKGKGCFVATNYRLYYLRKRAEGKYQLDPMTHIPLGEIDRMEVRENRYRRRGQPAMWLEIGCKGVRMVRFGFVQEFLCDRVRKVIESLTFDHLELSFAFSYKVTAPIPEGSDGWKLYDVKREYKRLGLPDEKFRMTEANTEYKLCSSYPPLFIVPSTISDEDLYSMAKFRSRGRIPALVWRDRQTGATIWRCSQPRVGLQYARNKSDEEIFQRIQKLNGGKKLIIFDARPLKNALANKAVGKGYEESSYYKNCEVKFMNIENIHRVRESFHAARKTALEASRDADGSFLLKIEGSKWLKHIRTILKATYEMVARVAMHGASVVNHCSDGWDRTSQLIANMELCLDPYFRTIDGFCVLIEKEWLSFGHQFALRMGHRKPTGDQDISPIFVQWLDNVWQMTSQFPRAFEFNSQMLLEIAHHASSLRFGTFLYNTDKDRRSNKLSSKTISLWTYLKESERAKRGDFTNPIYKKCDKVLYPSWDNTHVGVWSEFWLSHCYSASLFETMRRVTPHRVHVDQMPSLPRCPNLYEREMHNLQSEVCNLQRQLQQANERAIVAEKLATSLEKKLEFFSRDDNHVLIDIKEEKECQVSPAGELKIQDKKIEDMKLEEETKESVKEKNAVVDTEGDIKEESKEDLEGNPDEDRKEDAQEGAAEIKNETQ
mmetsp:Transcript_24063/g.36089  ORF Transcript_24063/g.36089 Transcript_24063/m.36089 type:complete len:823 (+) Transcript_24063:58-2526(+)|eukprot:CAMPEP_0167752588 /NCGR_PEP_ID=MMETSP0110_2-20121227/7225_1 /TAXON_ID=629695 /ORGANISM="Gymnochlora sp., Strain CCMP2014" /LENGTH=822 /DNA_ID=CAMNT_0007638227 /DNA_START=54 /DNA_END=2522 /DNA_ORIENTATION=-